MGNGNPSTDLLCRGNDTFTPERLDNILKNERYPHGSMINEAGKFLKACEIDTGHFEYEETDGGLTCFGDDKAEMRAVGFCRQLCGHDYPVSIAARDLDTEFSKVFKFRFEPLEDSQTIIKQVCDLLERMPARPPKLIDVPTAAPLEYCISSLASGAWGHAPLWEQLQVTTHVSNTVLRAALCAIMDSGVNAALMDMINIIATLLEIVSRLTTTVTDAKGLRRAFIVRAFRWTTWQRCQLIHFYINSTSALLSGAPDGKLGNLALRGTMPSPGITMQEMSRRCAFSDKSAYMCGWNFELLRTDPVCIGADFRGFHQRYKVAFGNHSARCFDGQSHSCRGDSPQNCQRFKGMVIQDQSTHDQSCSGDCRQLIWDESSYRMHSGARAVILAEGQDAAVETIQYCDASDKTLAISHVWSQYVLSIFLQEEMPFPASP